jgi:hypothetical protein
MLKELAEKAKRIDVDKLALDVAKANSGLIKTRVQEQLTVGENGEAQDVGKYKSNRYARMKQSIGSQAPFGIVDLKLSGKLHENIKVGIFPTQVLVNSLVDYAKYQISRYGKSIFELQESNQEDIKFKNSNDIIKEYSRQLGL